MSRQKERSYPGLGHTNYTCTQYDQRTSDTYRGLGCRVAHRLSWLEVSVGLVSDICQFSVIA
jgi:hypothetical protein